MEETPKIFLASDHRGFDLKSKLKTKLPVTDLGASSLDSADDYNDFAVAVAKNVLKNQGSFGILICGSAVGISIQANRFRGIRAAIVDDETTARLSREHNNANIICLSGDKFTDSPDAALKLIKIFLSTPFSNEPRHARRVEKLDLDYDSEEQ